MGSQEAIRKATARAFRLYPRSKPFRSVYMAGVRAALEGKAADVCPYKRDPRKTWRAAWRGAWMKGFISIVGAD